MKTAFSIINYNSAKLSVALANKVAEYEVIDEVIVIDNCSTEDTTESYSEIKNKKITILRTPRNGGYSYGINFAAKYGTENNYDILLISNPDIIIDEKDINEILKVFNESDYSALSGVEHNGNNELTGRIQRRDRYIDDVLCCFSIGRRLEKKKQYKQIDFSKNVQESEILPGCFFAVRLSDFAKIGGLDENVFLYCEERILSKKLEENNMSHGIVTSSIFHHNHEPSIPSLSKDKIYPFKIMYESHIYYLNEYEHIGKVKESFLKLCMKISLARMKFSLKQ